jgi:uncharacterized protein
VSNELLEAVNAGDEATALGLIADGADINRNLPLLSAIARRQCAVVAALIGAGARVDAKNSGGATALMIAALVSDGLPMLNALLEAGADPRLRDHYGRTALFYAAERGEVRAAERLLAAGADPTVVNRRGRTALDTARRESRSSAFGRFGDYPATIALLARETNPSAGS